MTAPLAADTVEQIVDRAGRPDFDRWAEQVERCGHCARPVRLRGRITRHGTSGQREVYSTDREPDRVLLVRCRNRRASVCPSCSYQYAGDMWQLLYAGAAGGRKGVPESIRAHPLVFATLTAPGFGPVHTTCTDRTGRRGRCRPPRGKQTLCQHGRPGWCTAVHAEDDARLGQPICGDCYDYPGHVAFNWHAPELWRRFTITLRRVLARRCGLTPAQFARRCRLSFVKVAEYQRRAVVHFHALIRLDGPGEDYPAPQVPADAGDLAAAVTEAAGAVRLAVQLPDGRGGLVLRFGEQTDVQPVNGGPVGELTPERVAAYIAKYATKSAEDFGLGDRRQAPAALAGDGVSEHVARIVRTCWQLGEHDAYAGLRRWVHMAGFRGHFASKSRRYSTTLGAIRGERSDYRRRQAAEHAREIGDQADDETTLVVSRWEFAGLGYLTGGDAALALSAAARARERREAARDES
jgi:hypothetical protein